MSAHQTSLPNDIRAAAAAVDPAKVSISKWRPVETVVARALHLDAAHVYGATISKPGNVSVRVSQSTRGRNALVVLLMYTGDETELEQCVEAAMRHCSDRDLTLVFSEDSRGWGLLAVVKPRNTRVPAVLAVGYPTASVSDF